jgi:nucleoside-diphosphate-sugar epimerase
MRIFVVRAEGAIGARLATRLIDHGHQVAATRRSSRNAGWVRGLSAEPIAPGQQPTRVRRRIAGSS